MSQQKEIPHEHFLPDDNKLWFMMQFIVQEGAEIAEEIDCRTEQEYNVKRNIFIHEECKKIDNDYERKEIRCIHESRIARGKVLLFAKVQILEAKMKLYDIIEEDVKRQIVIDLSCKRRRWNCLQRLIMESLFKLLEEEVIIQCREIDANLLERIIPELENVYHRATGRNVKLEMNKNYLPSTNLPGVICSTPNNKFYIKNTLEERVKQIMHSSLPILNTFFYGTSKMRH